MLNRFSKRRPPLIQLHDAAVLAGDMLVAKGVVHKENILEKIAKDASAPILPGVPSYLPHRWTIVVARKAMFELLKEWLVVNRDDLERQEKSTEFFSYAIKRLQFFERIYAREMRKTEASIKKIKKSSLLFEIFSPVRKRETTRALNKFFVDSFAVFVIVNASGSTTEYAEWFLGDWTKGLESMWDKKEVTKDVKLEGDGI